MRLLVSTLISSLWQLGSILALALFFFTVFAILGVSLWQGSQHYRCRVTPEPVNGIWVPLSDPERLCGGSYSCPAGTTCGSLIEAYDSGKYFIQPGLDLYADTSTEAFLYGYTTFDNFPLAFLTIFQSVTLEGWTTVLYFIGDAYNIYVSAIYFVFCIIICSYFLLNLTVAVMLENFSSLNKSEDLYKQKIEKMLRAARLALTAQVFIRMMTGAVAAKQAVKEQQQLESQIEPSPPRPNHDTERDAVRPAELAEMLLKSRRSRCGEMWLGKPEETTPPQDKKYYQCCLSRSCFWLVHTPIFNYSIFLFIIVNTVVLSLDRYPLPPENEQRVVEALNYFFTAVFALEMVFKLVGYGFINYIRDGFNILDAIVVIVSLVELGFQSGNVVSSLRALRLIRIMKLARSWDSLRLLINSIMHTLTSIGPFTVLLSLFIYVAALMGMQFFAGRIPGPPRANFDELHSAIITIFIVLVGQNWNEVMFDTTNAVGWGATVYFIFLVVIGNFVMLNLFLAILLGNFEEARAIMNNIKKLEKEMKRNPSQAKRRSLILSGVSAAGGIKHINRREIASVRDAGDSSREESVRECSSEVQQALDKISRATPQLSQYVNKEIRRQSFKVRVDRIPTPTMREMEQMERKRGGPLSDNSYQARSPTLAMTRLKSKPSPPPVLPSPIIIDTNRSRTISLHKHKSSSEIEGKERTKQEEKKMTLESLYRSRSDQNIRSILEVSQDSDDLPIMRQIKPFKPSILALDTPSRRRIANSAVSLRQGIGGTFSDHGAASDENKTADARMQDPAYLSVEASDKHRLTLKDLEISSNLIPLPMHRPRIPCCQYLRESSLLLFHKESRCRKAIISFAVPPKMPKDLMQKRPPPRDDDDLPSPHRDRIVSEDIREDELESYANLEDEPYSDDGSPRQIASIKRQKLQRLHSSSLFKRSKTEELARLKEGTREQQIKEYRRLKRSNSIFEYIVLFLIIASSITIAIDNPLNDPNSSLSRGLFVVDSIFTFLFLIEALLKIIAMGFCFSATKNRRAYMCNGWNVLDFVVVLASLLDFSLGVAGISTSTLKALKALRTIRALRPLRVISRNEGLKLVVNALISSIPPMVNVLLVCVLFVFIFAILGTNFFKGTFYRCVAPNFTGTHKSECPDGLWKNAMVHFDTCPDAMLTLFEMLNLEGWIDVMWSGIDSVGVDRQPQRDRTPWYALYFIGFIIVGNMFLLNLFVGVVIDNFNQMKEKLGGYFWLTSEQKKWVEVQRLMIRMKLKYLVQEPQNPCRKGSYKVVMSRWFEAFIVICIFCNTIVMALMHYRIAPAFLTTLQIVNYIFAAIFNLECIIKLTGLGKSYFSSKWNIFDFVIVIGTNLGILLAIAGSGINIGAAATGIRAFRIMRVIRLVNQSKHLRVILDTLVYILPSLANIGSMICLLVFIYAVLGMYIFAEVKYRPESEYGIGELRDYANFRQFGSAMLLLFRCATGESWNLLMHELADTSQPCRGSQTYEDRQLNGIDGCGSILAYPYFISFMVLISLMIMNLFVAVVIEGFEESRKDDEDSIINSRQLDMFLEKWSKYDPKAKGWIRPVDLAFLLYDIDKPLGYRDPREDIISADEKSEARRLKMLEKQLKKAALKDTKSITKKIRKTIDPLEIAQLKQKRVLREERLGIEIEELKQDSFIRRMRARQFEEECQWTDRSGADLTEHADQPRTRIQDSHIHLERSSIPALQPHHMKVDQKPTNDNLERRFSLHAIQAERRRSEVPKKTKKGAIIRTKSMIQSVFGDHILQRGQVLINLERNLTIEVKRIREILTELQLSLYWYKNGDYIHIRDVLLALSQRVAVQKYGTKDMKINNFKMKQRLRKEWSRKHPELQKSRKKKSGDSARYWAALVIQNFVRRWKERRRLRKGTGKTSKAQSRKSLRSGASSRVSSYAPSRRSRPGSLIASPNQSRLASRDHSRNPSRNASCNPSRNPSRQGSPRDETIMPKVRVAPLSLHSPRRVQLPPIDSGRHDTSLIPNLKTSKLNVTQRKSSKMAGSMDQMTGKPSNRSGEDSSHV